MVFIHDMLVSEHYYIIILGPIEFSGKKFATEVRGGQAGGRAGGEGREGCGDGAGPGGRGRAIATARKCYVYTRDVSFACAL